ncbi:MAG TPA: acetyl-CoA carboxylase carboxyltransferase subunit alpha [Erysipelothrix sp.]|nr:acetyl-CoA carboxylase carboxyltransferase subunit alpha [Erysipelothrix sp.]
MNDRLKKLEKEIIALKEEGHDTQKLELSLKEIKNKSKKALSPWDKVLIARDKDRPNALEYINAIFDNFIELHGDRLFRDDGAVVGGLGMLSGTACTVISIVKGKSTEENIKRNFGMVHPEGYRKALRLMKQAEKFNRPIITLIDTPGAYPGLEAEERGQGEAIAQNIMQMMDFTVPSIAIILGEAGSGGALALGVTNEVWMLEHSIYSILSPEGFASILFKDATRSKEVAGMMKITAQDLKELGVIERIFEEDEYTMRTLKRTLIETLNEYKKMRPKKIQRLRQEKFRNIGEVIHERQNT